MKKIFLLSTIVFLLSFADLASAHQPRIIFNQSGEINVQNAELSQAFYDELNGSSRVYNIESDKDFELYLNLLLPLSSNPNGRYSANVYLKDGESESLITLIDGNSFEWKEYYEEFGRDYYLKGPEYKNQVKAGRYKVEVFSQDNQGKYVLDIGETESFDAKSLLNVYWQLPLLKMQFFNTSVLQFFLTPFGIGGIAAIGGFLIFLAIINFIIGLIKEGIKHRQAKTVLLTSGGMRMKDEIIKLLQKPTYDINVAFISTASKPEGDLAYLKSDWEIMKELGFNLEEVDIEGKKEGDLLRRLEVKDLIYVEGGNTFYLMKAMRACNFERIITKLLKKGIVYVGVSAGSIVAGKTIKTAGWPNGDENAVGLKDMKGLNLVPFDIYVHYQEGDAEIIKKQIPWEWQRKKLRILTDDQAILVQGKETIFIGEGEKINI